MCSGWIWLFRCLCGGTDWRLVHWLCHLCVPGEEMELFKGNRGSEKDKGMQVNNIQENLCFVQVMTL